MVRREKLLRMSVTARANELEEIRFRVVVPLPAHRERPAVDIVVPVFNEEPDLETCVRRLHTFLDQEIPFSARITIADRASTDGTAAIMRRLAAELPRVRLLTLNETGRGRALAAAWMTSDARVVASVDVDPLIDLAPLRPRVAALMSGRTEISVSGNVALRTDAAHRLIPRVASRGRLFEAELVARAARAGMRIEMH